jgi:hypothetical protein
VTDYGFVGGTGGNGSIPVVVGGGGSSSAINPVIPTDAVSNNANIKKRLNFFIFSPICFNCLLLFKHNNRAKPKIKIYINNIL